MVIAIDGYEANIPNRVGIGRYAFEIIRHIYKILPTRYRVRVYLPSRPLGDMPRETLWWRYRIAKPKTLWTFFGLPQTLITDKPTADVIFSPTHYVPRFIRIPRVMAIMDLSYLEFPDMFRKQDLHKLTNWTAFGVRHAKKILTISQNSKNAILKAYRVPAERVVVTYPGITMTQVKIPKSNVVQKYKIPENYILSVGTIQPRKNYVRLIEAFSKILPKFPGVKLIIVGKKGWLYDETLAAPRTFAIEKDVIFLQGVTDEELPAFYEQAQCFALPSLYEGFGLPVLEAMAYRCPVVVSHVSSIPEIAGDAGIYVDPHDTDSIAKGLVQAINERETKQGTDRIERGLIRVKKFSWEKAAKQTLEVLTKVGKGQL